MHAHYRPLSQGYLLTLCSDDDVSGLPLPEALHQAMDSKQPSIWVDCSHIAALPTEALQLLRLCAASLWNHGGHLILCHLSSANRASLVSDAQQQPLAASLLDADYYGLDCPPTIS